MMTLNQLREELRPLHGHKRFTSENSSTTLDGYFDRLPGYMEPGTTQHTYLDEETILQITQGLIESIDSSIPWDK